jgi:tetratricopeptide (TPR) repeat protein/DNA-binding CsgD family transcriptional regulator
MHPTAEALLALRSEADAIKEIDFARWLELSNRGVELGRALGDEQAEIHFLFSRSNSYRELNDLEAARSELLRITELTLQSADLARRGPYMLENCYGLLCDREQKYEQAKAHYLKAIELIEGNDPIRESAVLNNLGLTCYEGLGDFESAVHYLTLSVRADPDKLTLYSLCNISEAAGDYVTARAYLEEAHAAGSENVSDRSKYHYYSARINLGEGNALAALEDAQQSVQSAEQYQKMQDISNAYGVLGDARYAVGDIPGSVAAYERFKQVSDKDVFYARALAVLARNYAALAAHDDEAAIYREKAEQNIDASNAMAEKYPFAENSLRYLAEAYSLLGNVDAAYRYLQRASELNRTLYTSRAKHGIGSLRSQMKAERDEHEKEIARMKTDQIQRDLSNATLHLITQNELLDGFRTKLQHIVSKVDEPILALKQIKQELKQLPCEAIDWVKFETQFAEVHPEFRATLKRKHPSLSGAELRLCMMLRVELKSSDVARLLCLSERTVETQRLSIRRKLGLKRGDSVADVLAIM